MPAKKPARSPQPQPQRSELPRHLLVVDIVVRRGDQILLIRRGNDPYKGSMALPGGFVEPGETVEQAACRELEEETGIKVFPKQLKLVGVYSDPDRDPRGQVIAVAFSVWVPGRSEPTAGDDAASAEWIEDWATFPLAFDHEQIIQAALS